MPDTPSIRDRPALGPRGSGPLGTGLHAPTLLALVGLLLTTSPLTAVTLHLAPDTLPDPTGLWLTENENAVIHIERCDDALCGTIHWMEEGAPETDVENPEESLRSRPLCGLEILTGFTLNPDRLDEWEEGEIYAADEGSTYSGRIRVEGPRRLELRGYRGITLFGRSQSWVRVDEADFPRCSPPDSGGVGFLFGDLVKQGIGEAVPDHLVEVLGPIRHLEEPSHLVVQSRISFTEGGHVPRALIARLLERFVKGSVDRLPPPFAVEIRDWAGRIDLL